MYVCISVYARVSITAYRLGTHIYVSVLVSIYVQTRYTGTYGVCTGAHIHVRHQVHVCVLVSSVVTEAERVGQ